MEDRRSVVLGATYWHSSTATADFQYQELQSVASCFASLAGPQVCLDRRPEAKGTHLLATAGRRAHTSRMKRPCHQHTLHALIHAAVCAPQAYTLERQGWWQRRRGRTRAARHPPHVCMRSQAKRPCACAAIAAVLAVLPSTLVTLLCSITLPRLPPRLPPRGRHRHQPPATA